MWEWVQGNYSQSPLAFGLALLACLSGLCYLVYLIWITGSEMWSSTRHETVNKR